MDKIPDLYCDNEQTELLDPVNCSSEDFEYWMNSRLELIAHIEPLQTKESQETILTIRIKSLELIYRRQTNFTHAKGEGLWSNFTPTSKRMFAYERKRLLDLKEREESKKKRRKLNIHDSNGTNPPFYGAMGVKKFEITESNANQAIFEELLGVTEEQLRASRYASQLLDMNAGVHNWRIRLPPKQLVTRTQGAPKGSEIPARFPFHNLISILESTASKNQDDYPLTSKQLMALSMEIHHEIESRRQEKDSSSEHVYPSSQFIAKVGKRVDDLNKIDPIPQSTAMIYERIALICANTLELFQTSVHYFITHGNLDVSCPKVQGLINFLRWASSLSEKAFLIHDILETGKKELTPTQKALHIANLDAYMRYSSKTWFRNHRHALSQDHQNPTKGKSFDRYVAAIKKGPKSSSTETTSESK